MDTEQIEAMFGNLNMSKQDYDQIAANMTKAIGATTSEAIANTQNVNNQDVYASYIAQENTINTAQGQYNQPVATDTINNIFNAGLSNATKAMTDLLKLDAQQADMMIDAHLEGIKLAQNGQHHKEEMELAWNEYELAQDELGFKQEKHEDEMELKWQEFYLDEEKFTFQKDKWEEEFAFEKQKHEEEMAYKYEKLAAQEAAAAAAAAAGDDDDVDYEPLAEGVREDADKTPTYAGVSNTPDGTAITIVYADGSEQTFFPGDEGYDQARSYYDSQSAPGAIDQATTIGDTTQEDIDVIKQSTSADEEERQVEDLTPFLGR